MKTTLTRRSFLTLAVSLGAALAVNATVNEKGPKQTIHEPHTCPVVCDGAMRCVNLWILDTQIEDTTYRTLWAEKPSDKNQALARSSAIARHKAKRPDWRGGF